MTPDPDHHETQVEQYRGYLLFLARLHLDARHRGLADSSDLVQQT